jgi:hypothetical protein
MGLATPCYGCTAVTAIYTAISYVLFQFQKLCSLNYHERTSRKSVHTINYLVPRISVIKLYVRDIMSIAAEE